jgi:hypothetical protein
MELPRFDGERLIESLRLTVVRATLNIPSQPDGASHMSAETDQILEQLARDVEAAVHSMYRGETRQSTAKARTDHLVQDARSRLESTLGTPGEAGAVPHRRPTPIATSWRPSVDPPAMAGADLGWTAEESNAVMKCITAWLPMGGPNSTAADTLCIAPGKMLIPTWGERERAREAVKKITQ